MNRNQELAKAMQQNIVEEIEVTPEEIRSYYKELEEESVFISKGNEKAFVMI